MQQFRRAMRKDLDQIVILINSAYRSDLGKSWTNEAKIVAGPRIDAAQLSAGLNEPNFELWVLEDNRQILGCIGLSFNQNYAEIGSYCVDPNQQNLGLGKKLLAFAEDYVKGSHALIRYLEMFVLNVRTELIDYYERQGYSKTSQIQAYPFDAGVGTPLIELHLVQLIKAL